METSEESVVSDRNVVGARSRISTIVQFTRTAAAVRESTGHKR